MPFRDAFAAATARSPRHCGDSARDGNKRGVPPRGVSGLSFYVGLQRRDVFGDGQARPGGGNVAGRAVPNGRSAGEAVY